MMNTATEIKRLKNCRGDARVYRLSESLDGFSHVIVSAAHTFDGPETYIFGCDKNGENIEYGELAGSFRGGLDHTQALMAAGYKIAHKGGVTC
jgi:hypothetical protein